MPAAAEPLPHRLEVGEASAAPAWRHIVLIIMSINY